MGPQARINDVLCLPLSQLQELHLASLYSLDNQILNILRQCRNLQIFSCRAISSPDPDDQLISLPHLHTLAIEADILTIEDVLRCLSAPRLRKLTIKISMSMSRYPHNGTTRRLYPTLCGMLTRSLCSLERFNVPYIPIFSDELIGCLELMPSLADLELSSFYISSGEDWNVTVREQALGAALLHRLTLTANTSSTCLLPNLRNIKMLDFDEISDESILSFVHSSR